MTRLGFVLDSQSCIGCHACTVACKSEHDVPLGVNRTWVKYIESGTFPNVRRHFGVMRCNHCDTAPCISICPTGALFRAPNGVVDFDDDDCIGCKACMNACPYDAIHINPVTNTAQKCNFCNHRVSAGLEPSCVVVCPTDAIKVADLDDPNDPATKLIALSPTSVRAPEQGTNPKVHYLGADPAVIDPLRTAIADDGMIWSDTTSAHPSTDPAAPGVVARTTYTTPQQMAWKWKVSSYLVTKAVAAGLMVLAALLALAGHDPTSATVGVAAPMIAGGFLALTGVLLVADLRRPDRFYYLISRGKWGSWLVKGAALLGLFSALCAIWWLAALAAWPELIRLLAVPTILAAAGTAGYTAFLFAQCEGRDLWQRPLLLPTLLAQALTAGGSAWAVIDLLAPVPDPGMIRWTLLAGLLATAGLLAAELAWHGSAHVETAIRIMTRGRYARRFWFGGVVLGLLLPALAVSLALLFSGGPALVAPAGLAALAGMWFHEDSFVRAGQSVPLS